MKPQVQKALETFDQENYQYWWKVADEISFDIKDYPTALDKYGSLIDDCFHRGESVKECADKIISKVQKRD